MADSQAYLKVAQHNQYAITITYQVHRTITTITTHLAPHLSQQNYLPRFTTFSLF